MSERDEILAEFEALGEAEVADRLARHAYDNVRRVYALQWLNQRSLNRMLTAKLKDEARRAGKGLAGGDAMVDVALLIAGVLVGIALAVVVFTTPSIVLYGTAEQFWLRAQDVMRHIQAVAMQLMQTMR